MYKTTKQLFEAKFKKNVYAIKIKIFLDKKII